MNEITELITVKKPSGCSPAELHDFAALVLAGEEVTEDGLDARIEKAEALVFLSQDNCLKGIAAIKSPKIATRVAYFKKHKRLFKPMSFCSS